MPKVIMQGQTTVAANSTVNNVLTGQKYERSPVPALGVLFANGSAAGLQAELNVNGRSVTDQIQINTQNRLPVVPDDMAVDEWEAPEGALIQLKVSNTTGGALTFFWRIELQEGMVVSE